APYPEAHFATFPSKLVEPCIKAGTSEKGCCAMCGAPWERVVERKVFRLHNRKAYDGGSFIPTQTVIGIGTQGLSSDSFGQGISTKTLGFRPTCDHGGEPIPCTVLDPLAGSGTVGQVARSHGRSAILIEIKEEYADLAAIRGNLAQPAIETFPEEP
ncbi:MAG TPA: DNA methyltransferase, partial [Thermoplasmata archaeon]|nr:DNA methyltransferase [Thermoplasmata archaeon]